MKKDFLQVLMRRVKSLRIRAGINKQFVTLTVE